MRWKATAIALAVAALVGWGVTQRDELKATEAVVPTAAREPESTAPFAAADRGGYTPGDDVRRYIALGTPPAMLDAWRLIDGCEKAERHDLPDRAERCNGITSDLRRKAGELLGTAMLAGVHGAAAAYVDVVMGVRPEELAQGRRDNPELDSAVKTAVAKLEEAASSDLRAIRMLARLYRHPNAVTGERDAEKALVYMTAEHELIPAQGFEKSRQRYVESVTTDLTPEQVQRAREAGLQLARNCDCKEG